jgi:peptidoglycan/xylan/chitin deacetylase (PgdA/CDA1 family)
MTLPAYAKASAAVHVAAGAAVLLAPAMWPWALGTVAANHLALTAGGLWPRSRWLGRNWTRLPDEAAARHEIAITIDDGPDPEVTPAVLDVLDAHRAHATFFVIGAAVQRHPALTREIARRGHGVQNHSDRHSHAFSLLGPRALAREVGAAQARLADVVGVAPRWFRAPAGLRNPFLPPVLDRLGLELVSWTRRGFDTVRREPARVLESLVARLGAGDILLLHDGHAARSASGEPVVLAVLPALLARVAEARLRPVTLADALPVSRAEAARGLVAASR